MPTVREPRARERSAGPRRRRGRLLVAGVLCVTAIAGVFALLGRPYRGALPPDTRVGGIELGGRSDADAARLLAASAQPVIRKGMVLTSGSDRFPVSLARSRIAPDTADALRRARNVGFVGRIRARLGARRLPRPRPPATGSTRRRSRAPAPRAARRRGGAGRSGGEGRAERLAEGRPRQGRDPDRPRRAGGVAASAAAARWAPRAAAAAGAAVGRHRLGAARLAAAADAADDAAPGGLPATATRSAATRCAKALDFAPEGGEVRLKLTRPADPAPDAPAVRHGRGASPERPLPVDPTARGSRSSTRPWAARSTPNRPRRRSSRNPALRECRCGSPTSSRPSRPRTRSISASPTGREFTTPYDPGEPRVTNIQRAAELLDGSSSSRATRSPERGLGRARSSAAYVLAPRSTRGSCATPSAAASRRWRRRCTTRRSCPGSAGRAHAARVLDRALPARARGDRVLGRARARVHERLGRTARDAARRRRLLHHGADLLAVAEAPRRARHRHPTDVKDPSEQKIVNPKLKPGEQRVLQESGSRASRSRTGGRSTAARPARERALATRYKPEDRIIEIGPKPPRRRSRPARASRPRDGRAAHLDRRRDRRRRGQPATSAPADRDLADVGRPRAPVGGPRQPRGDGLLGGALQGLGHRRRDRAGAARSRPVSRALDAERERGDRLRGAVADDRGAEQRRRSTARRRA